MIKNLQLFLIFMLFHTPSFSEEYFSLLMAGDTMVGQEEQKIKPEIFGDVLETLKLPVDFKFFNFEGTLGTKGLDDKNPKCNIGKYCYKFMSPLKTMELFKSIENENQIVFNIANNHSMDYGEKVQYNTYLQMKNKNFGSIGSLVNPIEKYQKKGIKVAFIGASPHKNTLSIFDDNFLNKIKSLKSDGYIVIVSLHMGAEGEKSYYVKNNDEIFLGQNRGNIYSLSHKLIDNGVDLIVGHGPHIMRGIEIYKNKLIAYSLGNFLTYGNFSLKGPLSYGGLLNVKLDTNGNFFTGKFIGTQQLKSIETTKWNKGIAIQKNEQSTNWLRKVSYNNFPNSSIKINNDGILSK